MLGYVHQNMYFSYNKIRSLTKTQLRTISRWTVGHWYSKLWRTKPGKPPYSHVVQIGDPSLRCKCNEVPSDTIRSDEIQSVIKRMTHVLRKYRCIGISAPQIGVDLRLFAMEFSRDHMKQFGEIEAKSKEMSVLPLTVVINPSLRITDYNKLVFPESCESVKGFWADVPRYRSVQLSGLDENGEEVRVEATGWVARIIQHETDHLNGKMYTDIMDRDSLTCSCWEAVNESRGKVVLPFSPD